MYPTEAHRAVSRLGDSLPAGWRKAATSRIRNVSDGLPVEHPLDFDWRFTTTTAKELLDRCPASLRNRIVLLGAPSLVQVAATREWLPKISLIDRNVSMVKVITQAFPAVSASNSDLVWGMPVQASNASVSILDPPWYPEYIDAFLWAASRKTRVGGRIFLSAPPEGTRPGMPAERQKMLSAAESFGLRLKAVKAGAIAYRTPMFERNALTASGFTSIPSDWRRGDLLEFAVDRKVELPRPTPPYSPEEWQDASRGSVRFKIRLRPEGTFRDPRLTPATPGDMLATVSRRDLNRGAVDVWTSGNRVFRCDGTAILLIILTALEQADESEEAVKRSIGRSLSSKEVSAVHQAAAQVTDLVRREEREIADYGHRRNERGLVEAI